MNYRYRNKPKNLLLGERNLHRMGRCDLEALQCLLGGTALQFGGKLDEGNVMSIRNETDFLEAGELIEQHGQHHFARLLRQIGEEQNLVGWLFSGACADAAKLPGASRSLLLLFTVKRISNLDPNYI